MDFILKRTYYPNGTNGELWINGQSVGYTIELPWLQNQRNISCIPEGRYELVKRYTETRGWHILVKDVPGRSWILFHPANHALKELKGCIAPVSKLSGPGKGIESRYAAKMLEKFVFGAIDQQEKVFITIKENSNMNIIQRAKAPTPKFFKVLRTIGLGLAAAGGALLAAPISLPATLVSLGGYLAVGGSVLTAVSQVTVEDGQVVKTSKNDG